MLAVFGCNQTLYLLNGLNGSLNIQILYNVYHYITTDPQKIATKRLLLLDAWFSQIVIDYT